MHSYESTLCAGKVPRQLDFLWLEITSKCNLECTHCYAESSPRRSLAGTMELSDWLVVLRDAAATGCRAVQFIGGEPTLHPHLREMIANAEALGYQHLEVFTNATAIRPELLESFVAAKVQIAVSFYSDEATIHDRITQRPGSFSRTVAGIRKCLGAGLLVRAGIIETPYNAGHALKATRLLMELGVRHIHVDRQREVGRASLHFPIRSPMSSLCGECSDGKLCVTSSGAVFPCVFARFAQVGHVDSGLHHALASLELNRFCAELESSRRNMADVSFTGHASDDSSDFTAQNAAVRCNPQCSPPPFCAPCNPIGKSSRKSL